MPHICTHIPDDPKFVLAMRITEQTYEDVYVPLASVKRGRTAKFENIEGMVLVVAVDSETTWGLMNPAHFALDHEAMETWSKTRFTLFRVITREKA